MEKRVSQLFGLIVVAGVLSLAGCAQLHVTQFSFQGDMARGSADRVAMAKGVARILQKNARIWESASKFKREIDEEEDDSLLRRKLFQFATEAEVRRPAADRTYDLIVQDRKDAKLIKDLIRFPSFDQIALDDPSWKSINPIKIFGGLGKTEFVLIRDDGGNYNIKSASFDPSDVVAAGVNSALSVMQIMATAYGIPAIPLSGPTHKPNMASPMSAITSPNLSSYTRFADQTMDGLDLSVKALKADVDTIDTVVPSNGNATSTEDLESTKLALQRYIRTVGVASRNVTGLQGVARLLPENNPLDRLAEQFSVASLSSRQIVAVYWAFHVGLANDAEKQIVGPILNPMVTFTNLNPDRIPGLNVGVVSGALVEINTSNVLDSAVAGTRSDLTDVNLAWQKLSGIQTGYADSYARAKNVIDGFARLNVTQPADIASEWGKALEFVKTHSADQLQDYLEDLTKQKGVVEKLGDSGSGQVALTLQNNIAAHLVQIKRVAELVEEWQAQAVLSQDEAQILKGNLALVGFPTTAASSVSFAGTPTVKELRSYAQ